MQQFCRIQNLTQVSWEILLVLSDRIVKGRVRFETSKINKDTKVFLQKVQNGLKYHNYAELKTYPPNYDAETRVTTSVSVVCTHIKNALHIYTTQYLWSF